MTGKSAPGQTDGEAVSRVLAFKLAPEIALVSGFSDGVASNGGRTVNRTFLTITRKPDQATDGDGAGVMFLLYLTDFLGIPLDQILAAMPAANGAPLGQTYVALASNHPELAQVAHEWAFGFPGHGDAATPERNQSDGSLNVPADGNPFPAIQGAKQGGLFTPQAASPTG